MPTSPNRNLSSVSLAILSLVSITIFSGCDLGTYKKRLSETPAQQTAPADSGTEGDNAAKETPEASGEE